MTEQIKTFTHNGATFSYSKKGDLWYCSLPPQIYIQGKYLIDVLADALRQFESLAVVKG